MSEDELPTCRVNLKLYELFNALKRTRILFTKIKYLCKKGRLCLWNKPESFGLIHMSAML